MDKKNKMVLGFLGSATLISLGIGSGIGLIRGTTGNLWSSLMVGVWVGVPIILGLYLMNRFVK